MKRLKILLSFFLLFATTAKSQDTIFIYELATQAVSWKLMPATTPKVVDGTTAVYGSRGVTIMPTTNPVDTYPNTRISRLQKASSFYSTFNFPFTAVTLIRYGINITAAVIGRHALLAFKYDVYDPSGGYWRNLHDCNPNYEDGLIQYGATQLHPLRYYVLNSPAKNYDTEFAVIEVQEDIGTSSGYFGLMFDTASTAYDNQLIYNISYPQYPLYDSIPVNGDTLFMKYGHIYSLSNSTFQAYYGANGEFVSPFFDDQFRIMGLRWSFNINQRISPKQFYFINYTIDSLANSIHEISNPNSVLYPNPVLENFTISLNPSRNASGAIFNVLGESIVQLSAEELDKPINVANLPKGIYILTIENGNEVSTFKFVKE